MTKTRRITRIAISAILLMLGAMMTISAYSELFSSIQFTFQLLFIFIISSILSPRDAAIACIVYLILGAIGVPVFSRFQSGFGVLFGIGGGFLLSFPFIAFFISHYKRKFANTFIPSFTVFLTGTLISYVFGFIWIIAWKFVDASAGNIFINYVLCFLPFDLIKCAVAPSIIKKLERILK